jgi:hypothetical protein
LRAEDSTIWHVANGEILKVGNRSQGAVGAPPGDGDPDPDPDPDPAARSDDGPPP